MVDLEKVASVLEKAAVYIDTIETSKLQQEMENRNKIAGLLKDKYEEATGDILSDDVIHKLAAADVDILDAIERLTQHSDNAELGVASLEKSAASPITKKEQAEAADDRFADFCLND